MSTVRVVLLCLALLPTGAALGGPPLLYTSPITQGVPPWLAAPPSPLPPPPEPAPPPDPAPPEDPCALYSPSMFGDGFRRAAIPATPIVTFPGVLNGQTAFVILSPVTVTGTTAAGNASTGLALSGVLGNFTLPISSQIQTQLRGFRQTIVGGTSAPLSTANRNLLNGILQTPTTFAVTSTTSVPGTGTIPAGTRVTIPGLIQNDILALERQADPRVVSVTGSLALTGAAGTLAGTQLSYPASITSLVNKAFAATVPTPGQAAGQIKVSDDNSPLPRDRVIFDYDFFSGVPLRAGGFDVHRVVAGYEMAFFDGWVSLEVRLPFAATLSNDSTIGTTTGGGGELGNLSLTVKGLVYRSATVNVSTGLSLGLPTADNVRVFLGSTEVMRIDNDADLLTPFVACLYTPDENVFVQAWCEAAFSSQGNRVLMSNATGGLQDAGRLYDQNVVQLDAQAGYWVINPAHSEGVVRGLAPFVELHESLSVAHAGNLRNGFFTIGGQAERFSELNVSLGAVVQLGEQVNVAAGAGFPLRGQSNRTFDYELGIRCNVFLGRGRAAAGGPTID
jgi:hypothetical protein